MLPTIRTSFACGLLALICTAAAFAVPIDEVYLLGPDSAPHTRVPEGKIVGRATLPSNVYPNTAHNYWVHVPARYHFNYTWGRDTHSNKHGGAIMPEMLGWLWRDYPRIYDP